MKLYCGTTISSDVVIVFEVVNQESNVILLHTKYDEKEEIYIPSSLYPLPSDEFFKLRTKFAVPMNSLYSWKVIYR